MNRFLIITLILSSLTLTANASVADKPLKINAEKTVANMDMVIKDNFIKAKYASAENRFLQNNVKASYDDFSDIISKASNDDYVFLLYGIKMAEYGFFDLSDDLIQKLDNNFFTASYITDLKRFYYPSGMLKNKDIMYYADAYSNIVYNNMALETTSELINSANAEESDYKNYLIALGSYKANNLQQALKYINYALKENDNNVNYMCLKARILADLKRTNQALKTLNEIKKVNFKTIDFQQKIRSVEEYVLYKTAKTDALRDYHLGYYYHLQGKSLLATKVLQSAIIGSKQYCSDIFGLLSRIYYENNEDAKAEEFATRAYRENSKNYLALMTLADVNYEKRQYEKSLKYYKKAKKLTKDAAPMVGIAKNFIALDQADKSKKIYENLLKNNKYNEDLLVESLKVIPQRVDYYLPRAVSIDISNNDIWLGLANHAISDGNFTMAATYLNNSYYIDENNFKYYYYLSMLFRAKGDVDLAEQSLIRCSKIKADYEAAIKQGLCVYDK